MRGTSFAIKHKVDITPGTRPGDGLQVKIIVLQFYKNLKTQAADKTMQYSDNWHGICIFKNREP